MKAALLQRLKRLEEVRSVPCQSPEFQIGYLKELPTHYTGDRHIVTVSRDPDGKNRWEERAGPAPANEDDGKPPPFRVILVSAKDSQPRVAELDDDIT